MTQSKISSDKSAFRLQGTDGIRREVALQSRFPKLSPQQVFLKKGIITEEFMERYVYAHVRLTLKNKLHGKEKAFVIGWDPRDPKGHYTDAVIRGIRKAGAEAWVIGTAPTPLVPMFMQLKNAAGGFMVTASHNPKDQNGIKIFLAYRGLKLLPENDVALTHAVLKQGSLKSTKVKGGKSDLGKEALRFFEEFHLSPLNSWADEQSFSKIILVVDPARGSLAKIAANVFKKIGFKAVHEVNAKQDGDVNHLSGVADLEGVPLISADMIDKGGKFSRHKAPLTLFELGRKYRDKIKKGSLRVSAAVFDADGDRFYRMDYDPFNDRILVLSGDETAYLQARFLIKKFPDRHLADSYIHTVESDLNTGVAAEALGLQRDLSPVGDKWILWKIVLMSSLNRIKILTHQAKYQGTQKDLKEIKSVSKKWKLASKKNSMDIQTLTSLDMDLDKMEERLPPLGPEFEMEHGIPLAVGSEETGHNITTGYIEKQPGDYSPVHCGNGLKSALNTFAATEYLFKTTSAKSYFAQLGKPFTPGFKGTFYAYYIDQPAFYKDSGVWKKIKNLLSRYAKENGYTVKHRVFPADPDMLYLALTYGEKRRPAAIFVRNSGTENKISVNLRGARGDKKFLCQAGEEGVRLLMREMKDPEHPLFKVEQSLLQKLKSSLLPENKAGTDPAPRVLMEMGKQGFTTHSQNGYQLTPRGTWYLKQSKY
ncbi:MAG: hypothetical protein G3M70_06330 [Candidatus Nitronauta litoralis]|uniref:Alpha-D-phosphohexomutase alpha/beta/alpha domain-containing protein n=1 Tax=Candidatus Nitronauta litoralis TaxID=2705533 RepID=A0A7T0BV47_9BACT|nr:MAG: hypothetical protein G3M70_06330 [Candidatus Nitronauta litoralis]